VEPVRRSVSVPLTPERAFALFTIRMERFWPRSHSVGTTPPAAVELEPRVGGVWAEVGEDGTRTPWGRVLAWDPPDRLVLAWQLSADWTYDDTVDTEVEVRFTAVPGGTRVDLEHRGLDAYAERAEEVRAALGSPGGWAGILTAYDALAAGERF
jgi:uncharacterized protein YndB with AHSA1/START domain